MGTNSGSGARTKVAATRTEVAAARTELAAVRTEFAAVRTEGSESSLESAAAAAPEGPGVGDGDGGARLARSPGGGACRCGFGGRAGAMRAERGLNDILRSDIAAMLAGIEIEMRTLPSLA